MATPRASIAKTILVGSCSGAQAKTIQGGIDAASAGDSVVICTGTYQEQITISGAGKNNLTLTSRNGASTVKIAPPANGLAQNAVAAGSPVAANVFVSNANNVAISNVRINDANSGVSPSGGVNLVGILYQDSNGTISGVTLKNQNIGNLAGGIWVDTTTTNAAPTTITSNTIAGYGDNFAIAATGANTRVALNGNTQNGAGDAIFIFNGASAVVGDNNNPGAQLKPSPFLQQN